MNVVAREPQRTFSFHFARIAAAAELTGVRGSELP